jgi:stress response protein YsnF
MDAGLDAHIERTANGWYIRLPLRREDVRIDKRTVVAERVVIRHASVEDVRRVEADLKRERLRVDSHDPDATQPLEKPAHHDTLAGSGMDQDPLA